MSVGIYPRTEEHRRKISVALSGRKLSEEHRKKLNEVMSSEKVKAR